MIAGAALTVGALGSCGHKDPTANKLVILHTNDTHSQIEPNSKGLGGVMRRMAVIDSVRGANANVLLVDAGDAVQGTLYFYLYGGEVEQKVLNLMGLDEGILGNHEFDNGIDSLASILRLRDRKLLSTNYDADDTPLDTLIVPYSLREVGGKKIAFIGINLDPHGMIADENWEGLEFEPIVETANATAARLRSEQGADAVIALTHIGYNPAGLTGDSVLATNSRGIDVIIGGHSHDVIDPATAKGAARSRLTNLDGKDVLVVQTGKSGVNIGKIELNLDSLGTAFPKYELLPVDSRYDNYTNAELQALIDRYKPGVDSLMNLRISRADSDLDNQGNELLNFFTDFVMDRGRELTPGVDLAIANKGGLRTPIPAGPVSKGQILNLLPFRNYVTVVEVEGDDLLDIFKVMGKTAGNGVSSNVRATYAQQGDSTVFVDARISGRPIDPDRKYRVATIDYLAKGGDYMSGFREGDVVASSPAWVYDDIITYITEGRYAGRPISGDRESRWSAR